MRDQAISESRAVLPAEHAESILRHVADAITVQAPDGRLLYANDAALRTLGFETQEELLEAPLSALMSRYDLLSPDGTPFPLDQLPGRLALGGIELARTVNAILWASRLDSGTLRVTVEQCDARTLVREVVDAARIHLRDGITLAVWDTEPLPEICGDPDKVRQVLANLLDNAAKYSPDGGVIEVRLTRHGHAVRFSVHDEGLGIAAAEQRRIFEKFYRVDPNLSRGIGGTGLGLYICRELVGRMDGRIWVESRDGEGSTFAFELPVAPRGSGDGVEPPPPS